MIIFKSDNIRFKYRVAGVALNKNQVLIHQYQGKNHWSLPGGHGEMLENSIDTLKREMREELDVEINVGRLLWIVENFFEESGGLIHELALYYIIEFSNAHHLYELSDPFIGYEGHNKLIFKWYPIDKLKYIRLMPEFLIKGLSTIPPGTEHLIIPNQSERN